MQGNTLQGEPGWGREIQRPDLIPGSTYCVTLGKSRTLSELHGLKRARMWSCLPYYISFVVRPWGSPACLWQ